jgi:hypothetical protein
MSLSDLASLGSFTSGVAVLISLVFLYFQLRQVNAQVRQAERNQQAAIQQERSGRVSDITLWAVAPPYVEAFMKGMAGAPDMTETELAQFQAYAFARITISEDTFLQHKNGQLNDEAFAGFTRMYAGAFRSPGVRVMWKWVKGAYNPTFVAFTDDLIAQTSIGGPPPAVARWKADLAEVSSAAP